MAAQEKHGRFLRSETFEKVEYKKLSKSFDEEFRNKIFENYGFQIPPDWVFYNLGKDSIWLVPGKVSTFDTKDLIVEIKGLYFSHYDGDFLRLSPEGAQIVGSKATKGILDITNDEAEKMIRGFDIDKVNNLEAEFVILKCPSGIIGVGKNHKTRVLCQIGKQRRVFQI
ncbi:Ribosomal RNA small subunit methyltransferase F [Candidatus Tiddalikarchaeum anstoanum]|nr:Ribosomal RNA small subunit methyltransferase F [Candidatus Tiddalikarchaeum anstoanum]